MKAQRETIELTQPDVVARLREATLLAGSQRAWARAHGVSAAYVSDVLSGRRDPGESILRPLGLATVVRYSRTYRTTGASMSTAAPSQETE